MSSNLFEDLNEFADGMFNFTVHFFPRRKMIAVQFLPSSHDNKALRLLVFVILIQWKIMKLKIAKSHAKASQDERFC